jgi:hypothetical protein
VEEPEMLERGCVARGGLGHRLLSIVPRWGGLERCIPFSGSVPDRPGHAIRFAACLNVAGNC